MVNQGETKESIWTRDLTEENLAIHHMNDPLYSEEVNEAEIPSLYPEVDLDDVEDFRVIKKAAVNPTHAMHLDYEAIARGEKQ